MGKKKFIRLINKNLPKYRRNKNLIYIASICWIRDNASFPSSIPESQSIYNFSALGIVTWRELRSLARLNLHFLFNPLRLAGVSTSEEGARRRNNEGNHSLETARIIAVLSRKCFLGRKMVRRSAGRSEVWPRDCCYSSRHADQARTARLYLSWRRVWS